jgi:hypothetical protein
MQQNRTEQNRMLAPAARVVGWQPSPAATAMGGTSRASWGDKQLLAASTLLRLQLQLAMSLLPCSLQSSDLADTGWPVQLPHYTALTLHQQPHEQHEQHLIGLLRADHSKPRQAVQTELSLPKSIPNAIEGNQNTHQTPYPCLSTLWTAAAAANTTHHQQQQTMILSKANKKRHTSSAHSKPSDKVIAADDQ